MQNHRPYTQLLDQKIRKNGFLILAHRGVSQGNIIENTIASSEGSIRQDITK